MKFRFKALLGASAAAALIGAGSAPALAQSDLQEVASPGAAHERATAFRTDTIEIELAPAGDIRRRHETEYMIHMQPDDTVVYSLTSADASNLWHEFHGHTGEKVTFYKKAAGSAHHGSMTAPFEGEHGWYLENRSDKPVKVQLKLSGFYRVLFEN
jgi:hypothetical protein